MGNKYFDPHLSQAAVDRGHKQRIQNDGTWVTSEMIGQVKACLPQVSLGHKQESQKRDIVGKTEILEQLTWL